MDLHEEQHASQCACAITDEVIERLARVNVRKALNPLDDDDYLVIVGRLARAMVRSTAETEAEFLNRAIGMLDVDWPNLTSPQRQRVIDAATASLRPLPSRVIPPITNQIEVRGDRMMRGTRRAVREAGPARFQSAIGVSLSLRDQTILDHMTSSQAFFITDQYGRRIDSYSAIAADLVAEGLGQGLGRDAITETLHARLGARPGLRQSRNYWNTLAATFMNRARTYAHLSSIQEAGITTYIFEAILDEVTTDQCAFLHGREFSVNSGIKQFTDVAAAEDPEAVKDIQPWVRVGRDDDGNRILFTQDRAGQRQLVAQVDRSRVGTRDDTGNFSRGMSTDQLQAAGITMPPLHGRCRSTIVANV